MSAADTFGAIGSALEADPKLGKKVGGVLRFVLTGANKSTWTVDCKKGSVTQSESGKADVTITISEADFVALASGKLTGMAAFMGGKMKMSGNMALAQKFGALAEAARKAPAKAKAGGAPKAKAAAAGGGAAGPAGFASTAVFQKIAANMAADPSLVKKVNGVFLFNVTGGPGGAKASWTVDAKSAPGSVSSGNPPKKADCTITIGDADLVALASGKLSGMAAFMGGKMKIAGNMALAQKFGALAEGKRSKL